MNSPANNPAGAPVVDEELMPKRAAFIKWAAGRSLDVTEVRDAWGARRFLAPIIDGMWEGWYNAPAEPAIAETSLIDLRDLLARAAQTGQAINLSPAAAGALHAAMTTGEPAMADDQSMPVDMAQAKRWVTQLRVRVDSLLMVINTPPAERSPAGYIDRKDLVRLSNCRATIWPGTNEIDAVPVFLGASSAGRAT
jgi:hypothetical protein